MFFVSVACKELRCCASPLFATHTRGPEVLHLKDLHCTKTVQNRPISAGGNGLSHRPDLCADGSRGAEEGTRRSRAAR